ncbi:MAG TPA: sigma-54 dependent transcriptional regulator [Gemmatales bacterium]|nr:sigma-54 dependent transcriptional regulator [Gemmatales bacterium]
MPTLLAIDDDPLTLKCYRYAFEDRDIQLLTATTAEEGISLFQRYQPNVVLCDLRLPDGTGLDVHRRVREQAAKVPFILATGHGTAETAIEAMSQGVFDYVVKPIDPDQLTELVDHALQSSRLMQVPALVPSSESEQTQGDVLIGQCSAMQEVYKAIGRVAPQDVTVLILGESGTGKEMVARAIYHYSKRSNGPFLAINCAAIPETLLESELFGHEKGAFTGADRKRIGKFEQCNSGTLFLDEIGDMTPLMQTKILRVLQDQRFERVGGAETIQTNVRVIAATNRDLESAVAKGVFRADLYYRLNVFTIRLPALRERTGDMSILLSHFVRQYGKEMEKEVQSLSPEAMILLESYSWPGNIRELQSAIKHALLCMTGPVLLPEHLPDQLRGVKTGSFSHHERPAGGQQPIVDLIRERLQTGSKNLYEEVVESVERQLFREVLQKTAGNQSQASQILGISRPTLRAKLAKLGLVIDRSFDFPFPE